MKGPTNAQLLKQAKRSPPIRIGTSQLQLLAVIERGPTYGNRIVEENPRLFSNSVANDGSLVIDKNAVYLMLKRLEKRGFIEHIPDYKPPPEKRPPLKRGRVHWFRLTIKGREVLTDNRQLLQK